MLRTLTFADTYVQILEAKTQNMAPTDSVMSGALALIRLQLLPVALDWKRKIYVAVINDIQNCGISMSNEPFIIAENVSEDESSDESDDQDRGFGN